MIKRELYLNQLILAKDNGFPKVITGVRRCGKSYLLKNIYHDYLVEHGVSESQIIVVELDDILNAQYRNPLELTKLIKEKTKREDKQYFVFVDEIQLVTRIINPAFTEGKIVVAKNDDENTISFVDVVLGLARLKNVDLYVTGSNSKLLSKDIVTEFRDKATNIHISPLSFKEYYDYVGGDKYEAFYEYMVHGGMPLAVWKTKADDKENKSIVKSYEVDFYATKGIDTLYIQVTDNIDSEATKERELAPFQLIRNASRKLILVNRPISTMRLENGILLDGIVDFLLNL